MTSVELRYPRADVFKRSEDRAGRSNVGTLAMNSRGGPELPPDPVAVLDAIRTAFERVNGRGIHPAAPPLADPVWYDAHGNLLTRLPDGRERYVMVEFERPLMERSAEIVCRGGGHVLNVGFGCGIVDGEMQRCSIASHTIVEGHPIVQQRMIETGWAGRPNVSVLLERWENVAWWNYAQRFDGIFFDPYPYRTDPLELILWRECVLKIIKPDTGVLVLYGPDLTGAAVQQDLRAFRKRAVLDAVERVTVDVPFVVPEWRSFGVGRHEVPVFSVRFPSD
jgi:hypothetical protein